MPGNIYLWTIEIYVKVLSDAWFHCIYLRLEDRQNFTQGFATVKIRSFCPIAVFIFILDLLVYYLNESDLLIGGGNFNVF